MKLKTVKRESGKKSESKRLRREGMIPAILYSRGKESIPLTVSAAEMSAILRSVPRGHLPTSQITLIDESGKERKVIVKDIQYHVTTYDVQHLDFEELIEGVPVNVKVPIECIGAIDCVGIKLGGVLRQVIRHLVVNCLPKDIPLKFELDISKLAINQHRKLSEIELPNEVRPAVSLDDVAVVIAKR